MTASIAAIGAVMVHMAAHSSEPSRQPAAMLLSVSVAVGVLALVLIATAVADWHDLAAVYRPVSMALVSVAVLTLLLGWLAPAPWLHVLILVLLLGAVWFSGMVTWFSVTHPGGATSTPTAAE